MGKQKSRGQMIKLEDKNSFLEITVYALSIDKLLISFQNYDNAKADGQKITGKVDIYLDTLIANVLAQDVLSGRIGKLGDISREKAVEEKKLYPEAVYTSLPGGRSAEKAQRADKKALSRCMMITPGKLYDDFKGWKHDWIISAESGPGHDDEKGLIVREYRKPEIIVRVPASNDDLKRFASAIQLSVQAWASEKIGPIIASKFPEIYSRENHDTQEVDKATNTDDVA